jgi:hypothetical protein
MVSASGFSRPVPDEKVLPPYPLCVEYDRKSDETRVFVGPMPFESSTRHHSWVEFTVGFSFKGRQIVTYPEHLSVSLRTYGPEANFLRESRDRSVSLAIGDNRVALGEAIVKLNPEYHSSFEYALVLVPVGAVRDVMSQASDGQAGTLFVGGGVFKLKPRHVTSLRSLYEVSVGLRPPTPSN